MPSPEISDRYQPAVLWPASGVDGFGQTTVGSPVEVRVQWNDKQVEKLDPNGNTVTLDATVRVNLDVAVGSRMWLGTLDDWNATGAALPDSRVMEVKTFNATPDDKNRYSQRIAGLMRWRNAP